MQINLATGSPGVAFAHLRPLNPSWQAN
jgi:hypothetical protein